MKRIAWFLALAACASEPVRTAQEEAKEAERKGDLSGAVGHYRRALEQDPENVAIHRDYQNLMRKSNRADEVRAEYRFKMEREPERAIWLYLYGRLLEKKDLEGQMRRALQADPNYIWAHHALVVYYTDEGRWTDALGHVEFVLRHSDTPAEAIRINAAVCYSNLKEDAKAEEQLRLAKGEFPSSPSPSFFMGVLHFNRKRFEPAAAELEEALRKDPRFFKAYGPLAQAYHAGGRPEPAAAARNRARDFYSKHPEPEMAREFQVVLEPVEGWTLGMWEKLAVEIVSPLEKGNWLYLARLTRPDGKVSIQYTLARTESLQHVLVRSVTNPSTRENLEPIETYNLSEADDFERFFRRVVQDSAPLRKKHAR